MNELLNNWKVVLLSLGGATTFWFFNALNQEYDPVIKYPVEFQFARDSVVIMEPLPATVSIQVQGGGWDLVKKTLAFNVKPVYIPMENPTERRFYTRSELGPIVTEQLEGLDIQNVDTDTLKVHIENKRKRRIPVRVDSLALSVESGFKITSPITIQPDTIELTGPESFMDTLGSFYPIKVKEKNIDETFKNQKVSVNLPNTSLISVSPAEVKVSFEVTEFERIGLTIPLETINFPMDSSYFPVQKTVDIFYTVPYSMRDTYKESDFFASVDFKFLNKRDSTLKVVLIYNPGDISDVDVLPERVKIGHVEK